MTSFTHSITVFIIILFSLNVKFLFTGVFDYLAYFNNSATGDEKDGNWLAISDLLTNAIFDEMLGKNSKPIMRTQAFPTVFKCDRAKWLETGDLGDLDCPSLLFGFLRFSIIDFVLLNLLPISTFTIK